MVVIDENSSDTGYESDKHPDKLSKGLLSDPGPEMYYEAMDSRYVTETSGKHLR